MNVFLYRRQAFSGHSSSSPSSAPSPWAIKKLRGSGRAPAGATDKSELADRMEREAKILKSISHPNIIGYRGFRRSSDGSRLLAVENGEKSLLDLIEEEVDCCREGEWPEPFAAKEILKVVSAVSSALEHLHSEKGYLHGDIKAANVLVKGDFDQVKICDFGVALKLDENLKVRIADTPRNALPHDFFSIAFAGIFR